MSIEISDIVKMDKYFSDYEDLEIHELMLKDRPRQQAYFKAIMSNVEMFKDKIVLDVGAGWYFYFIPNNPNQTLGSDIGTGILSIFCAKAGAKLVYAVEASKLAEIAIETIEENNLTNKVKVIHSKIEHFQLPSGAEKVDIIVSEWMGFYLLHESMFNSVLFARDNFLKSNGKMFPQYAAIYVAPCSVSSRFNYWNDIDGVKMTKFASKLRIQKSNKPEILALNPEELLHDGVVMSWLDLEHITIDELNEITFEDVIPVQKSGIHQGYCIWFEVKFPGKNFDDCVRLSTSPLEPETHWKQCIVVLPEIACQEVETSAPLASRIIIKRNPEDFRKYNIEVEILDINEIEHPLPCLCHLTKCILARSHLENMETEL